MKLEALGRGGRGGSGGSVCAWRWRHERHLDALGDTATAAATVFTAAVVINGVHLGDGVFGDRGSANAFRARWRRGRARRRCR